MEQPEEYLVKRIKGIGEFEKLKGYEAEIENLMERMVKDRLPVVIICAGRDIQDEKGGVRTGRWFQGPPSVLYIMLADLLKEVIIESKKVDALKDIEGKS